MTRQEIIVGYELCGRCGGEGCGRCAENGEFAVREWVEMDDLTEDEDALAVSA